jgi:hypothetical protein
MTPETTILEYIRTVLELTPDGSGFRFPKQRVLRVGLPSGAEATLGLYIHPNPANCILSLNPTYEPSVESTHAELVANISMAVERLAQTIPHRFGRALGTLKFIPQERRQYRITREDNKFIEGLINQVTPMLKSWVGYQGPEYSISYQVDPRVRV